jgi:flagellar M-ring protein FliF
VSALDPKWVLERSKSLFAGFTTGQKAISGVAVVAVLVGGLMFMSWAGKPTYVPLFTSLSAADAAAITAKLTETKTPYQLADGGGTIMVPQSELYQKRIDLSGAGLPAGGTQGYSLLDKQSLTSSEFQQQVTYQRALEGELSKTIEAIDGVEAAVVHLAVPQKSVFADDKSKTSGSVLVKTRPGATLSPQQVEAVVHLVSSSVPGLAPADVTVADGAGRVLNMPGTDGGGSAVADARTQQTLSFQNAKAQAVQSMLDNVLGPGRAVVRVVADLNYDQQTTNTERYITDKNAVPLNITTSKETYTGTGSPVGGVLGPDNISVPTGAAGGQTKYQKDNVTRNNAVGTEKQTVTSALGQVRRMSIAVVLDQAAPAADPATVSKLVSAAAGINTTRGDTVQVSQMAFDTTAAKTAKAELAAASAAKQKSQLMSMIKTGLILLVVALAVFWLVRKSRQVQRTPVYLPSDSLDEALQALLAAEENRALAPAGARELEQPDPAHVQRLAVRSEIGELIERQPDEVARLLRGWLADRRS